MIATTIPEAIAVNMVSVRFGDFIIYISDVNIKIDKCDCSQILKYEIILFIIPNLPE